MSVTIATAGPCQTALPVAILIPSSWTIELEGLTGTSAKAMPAAASGLAAAADVIAEKP